MYSIMEYKKAFRILNVCDAVLRVDLSQGEKLKLACLQAVFKHSPSAQSSSRSCGIYEAS
jgi:hypothetical protein